jgi:hypothetical protein
VSEQIDTMRKLGWTEEEIADVLKSDKAIDKGAKLFELDAEHEKASKDARKLGQRRTPTVYDFSKRERKKDTDKGDLIAAVVTGLQAAGAKTTITNPEREIELEYNGRKFKIVLSAPRK